MLALFSFVLVLQGLWIYSFLAMLCVQELWINMQAQINQQGVNITAALLICGVYIKFDTMNFPCGCAWLFGFLKGWYQILKGLVCSLHRRFVALWQMKSIIFVQIKLRQLAPLYVAFFGQLQLMFWFLLHLNLVPCSELCIQFRTIFCMQKIVSMRSFAEKLA